MLIYKTSLFFISTVIVLYGIVNCQATDPLNLSGRVNRNDYVDPHSIYYNKHEKSEIKKQSMKPINNNKVHNSTNHRCNKILNDCLSGKSKDVPDELFSRRLINMLLALAVFEENDRFFTSNIAIEVTKEQLRKLKDFGVGKATVRDVDSVINEIFKSPNKNAFLNTFFTFKNIYFYFPKMSSLWAHKEMIFGSIAAIYITWLVIKSQWTFLRVITFSVFVIFVVSFFITWLQLLKEADIKLTAKQYKHTELPIQCQPHKMSWWDKLTTIFSRADNCEKYFEAMMENSFIKVTPAQALSQMLAVFSFQPLGMAGNGISEFVRNIIQFMPGWMQLIMQPILIIIFTLGPPLIILLLIFGCLFGGSLSFGLGPLRILTLRGRAPPQESQTIGSKEQRQPIEILLTLKTESLSSSIVHQAKIEAPKKEETPAIPTIKNEPSDDKITNIDSLKLVSKNDVSPSVDENHEPSASELRSSDTTEADEYEIIQRITYTEND